ncbi:MAG TPA: LytTR family DNA-binding domain-containing protein [Ohtaekwangia sp.]|uniref:LytR/AlgR family response regulator transcription factor n=1 Tax=Ohtaekwangia sp. TaxID=2066019 RepID=UPI002F924866
MNTQISAIIIDDEQSSREILSNMLAKHCPDVNVVGEADAVASGKALIARLNPQVIFLDIEMPSGSGFDLLKEIGTLSAEVIFITAHNHYAIHAIRIYALDYLLKPINVQELVAAVSRIRDKDIRITHKILTLLREQLSSKNPPEQIAVPSLNGLEIVKIQNVLYCEGDRNYTTLYLRDDSKIVSSKTLKEYERMLPQDIFIRAHQKYLVNIKLVKRYLKGRGGVLVMDNGKNIDVAHSKKNEVVQALSQAAV